MRNTVKMISHFAAVLNTIYKINEMNGVASETGTTLKVGGGKYFLSVTLYNFQQSGGEDGGGCSVEKVLQTKKTT